jgi:hypothetical protein
VGSLERQVLPGARKFTELGVRPDRDIETIEPIDRLTREPQVAVAEGAPVRSKEQPSLFAEMVPPEETVDAPHPNSKPQEP